MSSLHSGLRHGSRRLLRILQSQQQVSPVFFLGQRTTAAPRWHLREVAEFVRGPVQVREFLTERCATSPYQHQFTNAAPEPVLLAQSIRVFSAAAEVGVKEGTSGPSKDDSKTPTTDEDKVEPINGVLEDGDVESGANVGPKKAEVLSKESSKIAELRDQLEEVEEELASSQRAMKEMENKMMRNVASAQNLVERTKREAESGRKYAVQGFAKDLLDVADNLSRAAAAVPKNLSESEKALDEALKHLQALLQGVEMTEKQLLQAFKKHGLEKDDPVGQKFDPNFHSAVFELEDESKEPGTVGVVLKAGYKLHERVIRPANVGVVKAKADPETALES